MSSPLRRAAYCADAGVTITRTIGSTERYFNISMGLLRKCEGIHRVARGERHVLSSVYAIADRRGAIAPARLEMPERFARFRVESDDVAIDHRCEDHASGSGHHAVGCRALECLEVPHRLSCFRVERFD